MQNKAGLDRIDKMDGIYADAILAVHLVQPVNPVEVAFFFSGYFSLCCVTVGEVFL